MPHACIKLTGKPILATGGAPLGNASSEAAQMKAALEKDFQVPVRWVEEASNNTRENAYQSFAMLKKNGITHIMLVTHAWHMPRAAREFEQAGFKVTPAAAAFTTRHQTEMLWYRLLPTPDQT